MKSSTFTVLFFFTVVPMLFLFTTSEAISDQGASKFKMGEQSPIVINANSLEVDNKLKIVTFTGNVDARDEDFIINCRKMLLYYKEQGSGQGSKEVEMKIDKIVATGNVKIRREKGGLATAERAVYYQNEEKIILTGKPTVKQGRDVIEGSKITLFLRENRSVVEGSSKKKVKAVFFPRSQKGASFDR